jgi:hypothetical protein
MKITVAYARDLEKQVASGKISFSRMVELLNEKAEIASTLEEYSIFLSKNGYMDTDWIDEQPTAIDEFLKEKNK